MKFQKIDATTIRDHYFLNEHDVCLYLGDYSVRQGFKASPINSLISNFKKDPSKKAHQAEWQHKLNAIKKIAHHILQDFGDDLTKLTWVPVPPSKAKDDPAYDDRLILVLNEIKKQVNDLDVRELVIQTQSTAPMHQSVTTRNPTQLSSLYCVNQDILLPEPQAIAIFDDLLTSGCHFRAMEQKIKESLPNVTCYGIFVGRSINKDNQS